MDNTLSESNVATLSLIIPIYNVEQFLGQCLESVLKQNSGGLEVILVDDGSTDGSQSIANEYALGHENWHLLVHQQNSGLGAARNTALEFANGKYLMMLDSDDWLEAGALDLVLSEIGSQKSENTDVIQFGCNKVYQDSLSQTTKIEKNVYCVDFDSEHSLLEHQRKILSMPSYACLKVVRRELVEKINLRFQSIYYEDVPWSISITMSAQSVRLIPSAIFNYRQRVDSITFTKSARHLDLLSAYQSMFEALSRDANGQRLKQALADAFLTSAYYLNRHRARRLEKKDLNSFKNQYYRILKSQKIWPGTIRTSAMMLITIFQLWWPIK